MDKKRQQRQNQFSILHSPLSILRDRRGFTLVELLVTVGIIVLFTAVLLPSFSGFGRRNELHQSAQLVETKILEARGFALAPRATGGIGITEYRFIAPAIGVPRCSGETRYAIIEVAGTPPVPTTIVCESLAYGVTFSNSPTTLIFSVLAQGALTPPNNATFQIRHPPLPSPNQRSIIVTGATGQIRISAPF